MKIYVVKIGGNLINNEKFLKLTLEYFCQLKGYKILVHGGGNLANSILNKMKIPIKILKGRRITDKKTLDVVVMTYAGIINKKIVSLLQYYQCNAIGLCGADGNIIQSFIREKKNDIDYGYVGDIKNHNKNINTNLIKLFLINHMIPVFSSITHNGNGILLNTNADSIASNIAIALSKKNCLIELHFCFEKKGVLQNIKDSESYFRKIDFNLFKKIKKNHTIFHGMIPKLESAFFALKNGVSIVSIGLPKNLIDDCSKKTILCL